MKTMNNNNKKWFWLSALAITMSLSIVGCSKDKKSSNNNRFRSGVTTFDQGQCGGGFCSSNTNHVGSYLGNTMGIGANLPDGVQIALDIFTDGPAGQGAVAYADGASYMWVSYDIPECGIREGVYSIDTISPGTQSASGSISGLVIEARGASSEIQLSFSNITPLLGTPSKYAGCRTNYTWDELSSRGIVDFVDSPDYIGTCPLAFITQAQNNPISCN